jgi:hypothetical protein
VTVIRRSEVGDCELDSEQSAVLETGMVILVRSEILYMSLLEGSEVYTSQEHN